MTNLVITTVTAQTDWGGNGYPASSMIDGNAGTRWSAYPDGTGSVPQWVKADLTTSQVAASYTIYAGSISAANCAPKDWTFAGSDDDSAWTTLDTRSGEIFANSQVKTYTTSNVTAYRYYRMTITATGTNGKASIAEWVLIAGVAPTPFVLRRQSMPKYSINQFGSRW